jgi:NAD(P)-dependent dehydrogenase (short-subunit alcohol dehydrogenase family)
VIAFTRHLAKEVAQYGIRVNCVAPATVLSERVDQT